MYLLESSGSSGYMMTIVFVVVLVVIMVVFMVRPQRKEQARKKEMLSKMEVGDTVCTSSGFYGTLIDVDEDVVIVEFGNNRNCRIPMQREAITQVEKPGEAIEE